MRGKQGERDKSLNLLLLGNQLGGRKRALNLESIVAGMKPGCCYQFCALGVTPSPASVSSSVR